MTTSPAPQDLFAAEHDVLARARAALASDDAATQANALDELIGQYAVLVRESTRLIRHSDRTERELQQLNHRLRTLAAQLEYRATHDPLTGVLNRGAILAQGTRWLAEQDTALIVLDIDHFKRINDTHGHLTGDQVIRDLTACVLHEATDPDWVGRVGGEEFTVLLPDHDPEAAYAVANAMRERIARHAFSLPGGVTASFGVSWNPKGTDFDTAYARADEALYAAKHAGRNQVACAPLLDGQPPA